MYDHFTKAPYTLGRIRGRPLLVRSCSGVRGEFGETKVRQHRYRKRDLPTQGRLANALQTTSVQGLGEGEGVPILHNGI